MTRERTYRSWQYLLQQNVDTRTEDVYLKILVYPVVLPLAWLIINFTGASANLVTICGLLSGVAGCFLSIAAMDPAYLFAGFISFFICDFIDGRVAMAKGGGTYLGTILDLMTDRTVLTVSVFALCVYHYRHGDALSTLLAASYFLLYDYIDMTAFVSLKAKTRFGLEKTSSEKKEFEGNTLSNNFCNIWVWLPSRLSSPILGMVAFALTRSSVTAYGVAIASVLFEYARMLRPQLARCFKAAAA